MATVTTRANRRRAEGLSVRAAAPARTGEGDVVQALCRLLGMVAPRPASDDEEVVLSLDLDGTHYSLAQRRARPGPQPVKLSAREREIARLISAGHTNKMVAAVLDISLWTVDTHVRRIFAKLGVRSRCAMVAQIAELGLIGAGD
jgi:DNA-binding CsgD family transcriptional regulator